MLTDYRAFFNNTGDQTGAGSRATIAGFLDKLRRGRIISANIT